MTDISSAARAQMAINSKISRTFATGPGSHHGALRCAQVDQLKQDFCLPWAVQNEAVCDWGLATSPTGESDQSGHTSVDEEDYDSWSPKQRLDHPTTPDYDESAPGIKADPEGGSVRSDSQRLAAKSASGRKSKSKSRSKTAAKKRRKPMKLGDAGRQVTNIGAQAVATATAVLVPKTEDVSPSLSTINGLACVKIENEDKLRRCAAREAKSAFDQAFCFNVTAPIGSVHTFCVYPGADKRSRQKRSERMHRCRRPPPALG